MFDLVYVCPVWCVNVYVRIYVFVYMYIYTMCICTYKQIPFDDKALARLQGDFIVRTYAHAYIYAYIHAKAYICVCVRMCILALFRSRMCVHACVWIFCMYVCVCVYMFVVETVT